MIVRFGCGLSIGLALAVLASCSPPDDGPPGGEQLDADAQVSDGGGVDSDAAAMGDAETDTSAPIETEWLVNDDGQAAGSLQYEETPDAYYEFTRFEVERPIEIRSLEAAFSAPGEVTVHVWDDFGGNFFNFDYENPLAEVRVEVLPADVGELVEIALPVPVRLVPGRMFYAGIIIDGEESPQLMVDDGQVAEEDKTPPSLVWFSNRPPDRGGFPAISAAPGDFMLRAEVGYLADIPRAERDFEMLEVGELGLGNLRRGAVADVDGDGSPDVMANGPRLYLNDGTGQFTDATADWLDGIDGSNGGVFADFDNDGDPDYFATGRSDRLLENDGGTFVDVTAASGIDDSTDFTCGDTEGVQHLPTEAAAWFDADGDGWLDLYQANYHCGGTQVYGEDFLWHNEGDGTFTKMELPPALGEARAGRGVAPADADGDGRVDLLVANYRLHPNFYLKNTAPRLVTAGRTSELRGVGTDRNDNTWFGHSIGAAWGDVDQDGRLDVFVANLAHPRFIEFSHKSALYRHTDRAHFFVEQTEQAGIRYLETPSNPTLWDFDNDSDLDLFFTCVYEHRTSQLYRNDGHPDWTEVSYRSGLRVYNGWGAVTFDLDLDGDLDLVADDRVFLNRNPSGANAVWVRLVGNGAGETNRDAVGARVIAEVDGKTVLRERFGGHGTGVQDSPWLHVGIGDREAVSLEAWFPATDTTIEAADVPAGARIEITEDGGVRR